jgi:hypothetical protein
MVFEKLSHAVISLRRLSETTSRSGREIRPSAVVAIDTMIFGRFHGSSLPLENFGE